GAPRGRARGGRSVGGGADDAVGVVVLVVDLVGPFQPAVDQRIELAELEAVDVAGADQFEQAGDGLVLGRWTGQGVPLRDGGCRGRNRSRVLASRKRDEAEGSSGAQRHPPAGNGPCWRRAGTRCHRMRVGPGVRWRSWNRSASNTWQA